MGAPWAASWSEAVVGLRLAAGLVPFLRHPIGLTRARAALRERLERRAADFLRVARHAIYAEPTSPYRHLLEAAGCGYADLEHLVAREGLEGALRDLLRHGVYLTVDEFKGRRPLRRGRLVVPTSPATLRNPRSAFHLAAQTSGSRGRGAGVDLRGAEFTMASEPTTAARIATVRSTGAGVQPCYAITDFGIMGYGCLAPEAPDDIHVFHDLNAAIQADGATPGLPAGSLLITSLRPTAPFVLLNVSAGDRALRADRRCGCPLEDAGWPHHLHTIRSFEKLTAGGMAFLDTDLVRTLEEVLPARFGGGPTDYQLVEDEAADGRPRLCLLVHPRVPPADPDAVTEAFLGSIGRGSGAEKVMELAWREAGFLRVERRPPRLTPLGKVLHLATDRPAGAPPPTGGALH